ncbi:DUF1616 domain-containing protein [Methanobacterium sp. SMA-27]|uniref:DUF1616 domain-containing protein n=1 Tax=Methanobacterium sp. SMA-27 TaxID=1495336 RepID=UPI000693607E|nr:DUF1616 domain-containing protein [Methanobacterium sp. SMA-27]
MKNPLPKGIVLIILLTVISMFCIVYFPLNKYPINLVSYLLLGLFLPGYAFMVATYPLKNDLSMFKRISGSIIISGLLALLLLLISYYQIIGISYSSVFLLIGILTILLSIDALGGSRRNSKEDNFKPNEEIAIYNIHHSIKDISIVIFLTLLSLVILSIPIKYMGNSFIYILKPVFSYLLIFIVSGYAFWAALIPRKQLKAKRLLLTLIFGIMLFIVSYFLLKFNPLKGPSLVFTSILSIFIGLMCIITILRRINTPKIEKYPGKKYDVSKQEVVYEKVESKSPANEKLIRDDKKLDIIYNEQGSSNFITNEHTLQESPKIRFKSLDLLLIAITTVISIIYILNPILNNTVLEPVLGIILILFLPGYAIISVIFPKKDYLYGIERLALSFAFPLIGLAIFIFLTNSAAVLISLKSLSIVISVFTILMVLIGFIRRRRVADDDRFYLNFGGSKTRKILTIILILSIILAISTAVYIIFKPNQNGSTNFNILSPVGNASVYPTNLTVGENGTVILGIVNNESKTVDYHLIINSNGVVISEQNLTLTKGENKEIPYTFTAGSVGYKKIEFLLYKMPDNTNIYRSQYIYVNMV